MVIELVAPLAANGVYTSGTRDMNAVHDDYGVAVAHYEATVDSDQSGAIEIDQSTDQIVWASGVSTAYTAATGVMLVAFQPTQQYVRAKYTNGTTLQTRFAMTTGVDY